MGSRIMTKHSTLNDAELDNVTGAGDFDFQNSDVASLVSLVMMQCARTNADVLRDIMAGLPHPVNHHSRVRR
jgi:hypothetical protein